MGQKMTNMVVNVSHHRRIVNDTNAQSYVGKDGIFRPINIRCQTIDTLTSVLYRYLYMYIHR
jgi:hypothetical protein